YGNILLLCHGKHNSSTISHNDGSGRKRSLIRRRRVGPRGRDVLSNSNVVAVPSSLVAELNHWLLVLDIISLSIRKESSMKASGNWTRNLIQWLPFDDGRTSAVDFAYVSEGS
ncbi:uncharacterized protein A4U43_C03F28300, partial [Asparagus officinalis]